MMRRPILMLLCVVLVSIIALPAFADEASVVNGTQEGVQTKVVNYPDYIPSGLTGNLMDNHTGYGNNAPDRISVTVDGDNRTYDLDSSGEIWCYARVGENIKSVGSYMENGKIYVATYKAKNMAPERVSNPRFGLGVFYGSGTIEHVDAEITGTDWHTVKGYFKPPSNATSHTFDVGYYIPKDRSDEYVKGIPGASVMLDTSSIYVAEETAYDMSVAVANAKVQVGAVLSAEAKLTNQLGETGNLRQSFEWLVVDKDRSFAVEGFNVTPNEDGTVKVSVPKNAKAGKYVLYAKSQDYEQIKKGAEFEVIGERVTLITMDDSAQGLVSLSDARVEETSATQVMFVIASYNSATNRMIEAEAAVVTVVDGVAALGTPVTISTSGADKVRAFVWDANGCRPIAFADGVEASK